MKELTIVDSLYIESLIAKDYARHYFIALGLKKGFDTYKKIYNHKDNILFHRASGNLQLVRLNDDLGPIKDLIHKMDFKTLIGPRSTCYDLGLKVVKEGAFIAELKKEDYQYVDSHASRISIDDLQAIEDLYKKVFPGYPKLAYMEEKLLDKRGSGFMLASDHIMSVAQSDFGQLIVGVATDPSDLRHGYAEVCMHALLHDMFKSESKVYLQYDNPIAGRLYEKLGFKIIDQVMHYVR